AVRQLALVVLVGDTLDGTLDHRWRRRLRCLASDGCHTPRRHHRHDADREDEAGQRDAHRAPSECSLHADEAASPARRSPGVSMPCTEENRLTRRVRPGSCLGHRGTVAAPVRARPTRLLAIALPTALLDLLREE